MRRLVRRAAYSLLTRLLMVEGITILVALLLLPALARSVLERSVGVVEDDLLRQQASVLATQVHRSRDGGWRITPPGGEAPAYASDYDGLAYALVDGQGRVLDASTYARPARWPAGFVAGRQARFAAGPLVGLAQPVPVSAGAGGPAGLRVIVTQDQQRPGAVVDDVLRAFLDRYLLPQVGLLVLMLLVNVAVLWPLLGRLRRTAREVARLDPTRPGARLDPAGLPAETLALVEAVNGLLARVEAGLRQQEEFAGNVAHELRNPLATMRVEVARLAPGEAQRRLAGEIERIAHVLAQLRDLAGLENAAQLARGPVDLAGLVVELVAEMTPQLLAGGRQIAVTGAERPMMVAGNRALLTMALTNLIDNARLHTPPGTSIEIALAPGKVSVSDDGPGIVEADQHKLVRRFWRADHRRSDGAGLGLSIVQRIIEAHGGQLGIAAAPGGGARFTLELSESVPG